ncbi:MAG: SUF system NifU family Fe-S cluster assembly protein [Wenzhouxiangella sp.]|nr:MAG: SUF system NifU family Fe-S cluster assembly protein [Wenzhouxiangella sp.]
MALDRLYQQTILEHNRKPRNFGRLAEATHAARGQDALCGDDILIELIVEGERVRQAAFSGEACAVTKASASMLTEWLTGRQVAELIAWRDRFEALLKNAELEDAPELGPINQLRAVAQFPARLRNVLLPWNAAGQAVT